MIETLMGVMGAALIGVFGWAFTLNSRVSVLEAERAGLASDIALERENLKELVAVQFRDITERLRRIESKLDRQ